MSLIVFGSINMDLVTQTPRLPRKGETVQGKHFFTASGGKGANQAVAAGKLGTKTYLVGRVGDDSFGKELLAGLQAANVNTDYVTVTENMSSGVAVIAVDEHSDNNIIVVPGANGCVDETDVGRLKELLSKTTDKSLENNYNNISSIQNGMSSLLLQLEVPLRAIEVAATVAIEAGIKVILDPAPAPDILPGSLYRLVDIITPNETEASRLVGFEVNDEDACQKAAEVFLNWGVGTVVLKLGARGAFCANASESFMIPAFQVKAVDTVAAGDAFNGAMAVAFDRGLSLRDAIIWGAAAGALATTKHGAQPSLPHRATFEAFLALHPF